MIRGTTPQIMLTVEGHDLTGTEYVVSFSSGQYKLNKSSENCEMIVVGEDSQIVVRLTQQETLAMKRSPVIVQVNWIDSDGIRNATEEASIVLKGNIYEKVMKYE